MVQFWTVSPYDISLIIICTFCRHFIENSSQTLDLTKLEDAQWIVDEAYNSFFSLESLKVSEDSRNMTAYNFRLRLRDLASVVEADDAQRMGDVGRLMLMWKRWSIMAHGMKGLSHYSKHLPRLVLLLEVILPQALAHNIKHSLLLPTGEREGHWVAKDQYLEQNIFSLKYLYNNAVSPHSRNSSYYFHIDRSLFQGNGTDLRRLTDRYSLNIPLVSPRFNTYKCFYFFLSDCDNHFTVSQANAEPQKAFREVGDFSKQLTVSHRGLPQ